MASMAPRVNCDDVPECGYWNRKSLKSYEGKSMCPSNIASLKSYEGKSMCEEKEKRNAVSHEQSLLMREAGVHMPQYKVSEMQDPTVEDEVALELAISQSKEEASNASSDVVLQDSKDDLEASVQPTFFNLFEAPECFEISTPQQSCACSEATDPWDLCETASISSSWLDLQDEYRTEHLLEEEGDVLILKPDQAAALVMAAKPPSFAEVLARSAGNSRGAAPRLVKPSWVTSRSLKPVPEDQSDEHKGEIEDREMYKSPGAQHWRGKRPARKRR